MIATLPVPGPTRRTLWTTSAEPAVGVVGSGQHLPDRVVGNRELARLLGVEPTWVDRTAGVARRRWATPGESTADVATGAVRAALRACALRPEQVTVLVVAAESAPQVHPAVLVRERLDLNGAALDLAVDFVAALAVAHSIVLAAGGCGVVVGAQVREIDPFDDPACVRTGDGAGALVLARTRPGRGLNAVELAGSGRCDLTGFLTGASVPPEAVAHVVGSRRGLCDAQVHTVEQDLGDTGPAAIPLALALAPPIAPGERVLLTGPPDHPSLALLTW